MLYVHMYVQIDRIKIILLSHSGVQKYPSLAPRFGEWLLVDAKLCHFFCFRPLLVGIISLPQIMCNNHDY